MIRNCVSTISTDIALDAKWDARNADASVNRCIAAATECLKSDAPTLNERRRIHLHQILLAMRHGYFAVRELLRSESEQPLSVSSMSVVRSQVETLYAICLVIERPEMLDDYLKDGWKKLFVRHILMREECPALPRVTQGLRDVEPWLEQMRIVSGVTEVEKQTVEADELGIPLPSGVAPVRISSFPTPRRVINEINDPDRRRMLERLYPEYQFLCGFVHFSPATVTLTSLLDSRQPFRKLFTTGQVLEMWQKEIAGPAMWLNVVSVVQCCGELLSIYPKDVELARCCVEAWEPLCENTFLGRVIWQLRARKLLGAIN